LSQEAGLNLRIVAGGKVGTAGTTDLTLLDDLVSRAFASSAEGETVALDFPPAAGLPAVRTWDDAAAGANVAALTALGSSVIERSLTIVKAPQGRLPVLFTTQGLGAVLMPVNQGLSGKQVLQGISPLGGKLGEKMFDAKFSLTDDPLIDGRVASRRADEEGVT